MGLNQDIAVDQKKLISSLGAIVALFVSPIPAKVIEKAIGALDAFELKKPDLEKNFKFALEYSLKTCLENCKELSLDNKQMKNVCNNVFSPQYINQYLETENIVELIVDRVKKELIQTDERFKDLDDRFFDSIADSFIDSITSQMLKDAGLLADLLSKKETINKVKSILTNEKFFKGNADNVSQPVFSKPRNVNCIGRDKEIEEILICLYENRESETPSIIEVAGTLGIGKTTVCRRCLYEYAIKYDDDKVIVVETAGCFNKETLQYALLKALKMERKDDMDIDEQIENYFMSFQGNNIMWQYLIYFDGFEGPMQDNAAKEWLINLIDIPRLRVLFSTRVMLNNPHIIRKRISTLSNEYAKDLFLAGWGNKLSIEDETNLNLLLEITENHTLTLVILSKQEHFETIGNLLTEWERSPEIIVIEGDERHASIQKALSMSCKSIEENDKTAIEICCAFAFIDTSISKDLLLNCIFSSNESNGLFLLYKYCLVTVENGLYRMLNPIRAGILPYIDDKEKENEIFIRIYNAISGLIASARKNPFETKNASRVITNIESIVSFLKCVMKRTKENNSDKEFEMAETLLKNLEPFLEYSPVSSRDLLFSLDSNNVTGHFRGFLKRCLGNLEVRLCDRAAAGNYYNEAVSIYEHEVKDDIALAQTYFSKGDLGLKNHEISNAKNCYHKAIEYYGNDLSGIAECNKRLGDICCINGRDDDFREAIKYYQTAIELYEQAGNNFLNYRRRAETYKSIGGVEIKLSENDYQKAISAYAKAVDIFNDINDQLRLASIYKSMGDLESDHGSIAKARTYYDKSLDAHKHITDNLGFANVSQSRGELEFRENQPDKAFMYFSTAAELYTNAQDQAGLANTYKYLGDLFSYCDDYSNALKYYEKAKEIYHSFSIPEWLGDIYKRIGDLKYKFNRHNNSDIGLNEYQEAKDLYQKANAVDKYRKTVDLCLHASNN